MKLYPHKPMDKYRFPAEVEAAFGFPLALTLLLEQGFCMDLQATYQDGEELTKEDQRALLTLVLKHEA